MKSRFRGLILGEILVLAAALPLAAQAPGPMPLSVSNYEVVPADPQGEMVPVLEKKFGVRLRILNLENQRYQEQLNLRIASGDIPDFLYLRQATSLVTYARLGVLTPISEPLLRDSAPHLYELLQTQAPGYLDMGRVDGVLYGIPVISPTNQFHVPLVYRQDWMDRVGVHKTPETLAEFEALMYKFAKEDPDGNGKRDTWGLSKDGLTAVFGAFGLVPWDDKTDYWLRENGTLVNSTLSPRARQALALLAKWYRDGIIDPEFVTGENKGGYWALSHSFVSGRIGFTTHGNYYHWITRGAYDDIDASGKRFPVEAQVNGKALETSQPGAVLAFGEPLTGPDGRKGIKEYNRLMNFVTIGRPAARTPGKVETIFKILDASADPDPGVRLPLRYGIEGRHWRMLDPATETVQILAPFAQETGYAHRIGLVLSIEVPLPSRAPREQWAHRLGLDRNGIESAVQVGLPRMMQYDLTLKRLRDEAYLSIVTGARPVSSFDDFVQAYRKAGGAEAEKEVNEYDRGRAGR